jgi:hypothetical protein
MTYVPLSLRICTLIQNTTTLSAFFQILGPKGDPPICRQRLPYRPFIFDDRPDSLGK